MNEYLAFTLDHFKWSLPSMKEKFRMSERKILRLWIIYAARSREVEHQALIASETPGRNRIGVRNIRAPQTALNNITETYYFGNI